MSISSNPMKKFKTYLPYALIVLFCTLFYYSMRGGSDFFRYINWSSAIKENNIFKLPGKTLSPMGVPLSQHSSGPGLLFLIGNIFFKDLIDGALFVGWIFSLIFWWALLGTLYCVSHKNVGLTLFGALIAFVGTHLGFYSTVYSSESLSYSCFAVMVFWVIKTKAWKMSDSLLVGMLAGLLIIIRLQLAIYCISVFGTMYYLIFTGHNKRSRIKTFMLVFLPILPVLVGIIEVGLSNRWMTGSFFSSAYVFGSGAFKSLDWKHPEFSAVLFNPWHGLLAYHPLYALGCFALFFLILSKKRLREKFLCVSLLMILFAHLYLQASWYDWWLGTGTFGMRGLGIWAIILIPCLIHLLAERERRNLSNRIWFIFIFACCVWSYLLLMQNRYGYTQFYTYQMLLTSQYNQLISFLSYNFIFSQGPVICVAVITLAFRKKALNTIPYGTTLFLAFMTLYYLLDYSISKNQPGFQNNYFIIFTIKTALLMSIPFLLDSILFAREHNMLFRYAKWVVTSFLITLFVTTTYYFAKFAVNTERSIYSGVEPPRSFSYISDVDIDQVERAYNEYLKVPGFDNKKVALYNYLNELRELSRK